MFSDELRTDVINIGKLQRLPDNNETLKEDRPPLVELKENAVRFTIDEAKALEVSASPLTMVSTEPAISWVDGSYTMEATKDAMQHKTTHPSHVFRGKSGLIQFEPPRGLIKTDSNLSIESSELHIDSKVVNVGHNMTIDQGLVVNEAFMIGDGLMVVHPPNKSIPCDGNLTVKKDATISGNLTCNACEVKTDLMVGGNVSADKMTTSHATVSGTFEGASLACDTIAVAQTAVFGVGATPASGKVVTVAGDAMIQGEVQSESLQTSKSIHVGQNLSVGGSASIRESLNVDGNLLTSCITSEDRDLNMNANVLYFNTESVCFRSKNYTVESSNVNYTDKIIRLGTQTMTDSLRDRSGVMLVGKPDNTPSNVKGDIGIRWVANKGVFDEQGALLPPPERSRWTVEGGNLCLWSADEQYAYMFSIDNGELTLWKMTVKDGAVDCTQKVSTFGYTSS